VAGTFKVKPDDARLVAVFARAREVLGDLRQPLEDSVKELNRRKNFRFTFKRDPDGNPWPEWAESTKARYRGQKRTLMLNTKRTRDRTRFIAGRRDIRVVIGTPYGYHHEQPDGKNSEVLPRRAFIFSYRNGNRALARTDEAFVLNELRYAIDKALGD
jgi:hypothetical protein